MFYEHDRRFSNIDEGDPKALENMIPIWLKHLKAATRRCKETFTMNSLLKLYLNPSSFLIAGRTELLPAAVKGAGPNRNPFFAKSIAGCTRFFHGNLPYSFQAA